MEGFRSHHEHLSAELNRLRMELRRLALVLRSEDRLTDDGFRGLYIPDQYAEVLFRHSDSPAHGAGDHEIRGLSDCIAEIRAENSSRARMAVRSGVHLPLLQIATSFRLSTFELDVLLLCAAPEIELRYETLYAYVQNDVTQKRPAVELALRLYASSFEQRVELLRAFECRSTLVRDGLITFVESGSDLPLSACQLRLERRILGRLLGEEGIDPCLSPFLELLTYDGRLSEPPFPKPVIRKLRYAADAMDRAGGFCLLRGSDESSRRIAARVIAAKLGRPLLSADVSRADRDGLGDEDVAKLARREARLHGAALYLYSEEIRADSTGNSDSFQIASDFKHDGIPLMIGCGETGWVDLTSCHDRIWQVPLDPPEYALRLRLWGDAIRQAGGELTPETDIRGVADDYSLSEGAIFRAARRAADAALLRPRTDRRLRSDDLRRAARDQSTPGLRALARKLESVHDWKDLVLPARVTRQLREIVSSVRHRRKVYSEWGFDPRRCTENGLNALFRGPSGTGKTMAATILAGELGLELYRIDLACVVSKYIGETEKNLSRIFDEARSSSAILFFDEADALFGKRSEVKDAHDRYANIEVAYLLQKMEEYSGLAILATNLGHNLDDAFARRIQHTIDFPLPDAEHRERIWRLAIPEEAPTCGDVDLGYLGRRFDLSGGGIRNAATAAAFFAAEQGCPIGMDHLALAVARELQKSGKLPSAGDFGPYYDLIRENA